MYVTNVIIISSHLKTISDREHRELRAILAKDELIYMAEIVDIKPSILKNSYLTK